MLPEMKIEPLFNDITTIRYKHHFSGTGIHFFSWNTVEFIQSWLYVQSFDKRAILCWLSQPFGQVVAKEEKG